MNRGKPAVYRAWGCGFPTQMQPQMINQEREGHGEERRDTAAPFCLSSLQNTAINWTLSGVGKEVEESIF